RQRKGDGQDRHESRRAAPAPRPVVSNLTRHSLCAQRLNAPRFGVPGYGQPLLGASLRHLAVAGLARPESLRGGREGSVYEPRELPWRVVDETMGSLPTKVSHVV